MVSSLVSDYHWTDMELTISDGRKEVSVPAQPKYGVGGAESEHPFTKNLPAASKRLPSFAEPEGQ